MLENFKLDIQKFSSGGGTSWSEGITISAIDEALSAFRKEVDAVEEALKNYTSVDSALKAGWSGEDCTAFIEKYHAHASDVCTQIEEYYKAVASEVDNIKTKWTEFQASNIA